MTRAAIRLAAYLSECLGRAKRGGRHWLRLPLASFMRATGYAERTARGAWAQVRDQFESRLVRFGRSDVSMVALQGTLSPCIRSERKGKPSALQNENNTEHGRRPARTTENFPVSIQQTGSKANRDPLRRLAAWFAWRLGSLQWDSCRVRFNSGFAFAYAAKALALGYDRDSIAAAYEAALRDEHTVASDVGAASWRPFRLMGIALRQLASRGTAKATLGPSRPPVRSRPIASISPPLSQLSATASPLIHTNTRNTLMNASPPDLPDALGRMFARKFRAASALDFKSTAKARNQRRNLNLAALGLVEHGSSADAPEVQSLRREIADLHVKSR